ncbi:MAG: F0F1 ATP synthase subunit B, partial [Rhodospirillaceae bacterium]|nr:F0F1 ATP synthase subunit B [Rhodospirillaceae bacterium]
MSTALAADAAGQAAPHAFYEDPTFIVLICFIITFALAGKAVYTKIAEALDARSEGIRDEIEEATKLREDAQDLLASFERKQREAIKDAEAITERAKSEADFMRKKSAEDLELMMARRERQAKDRIQHAEIQARDEIQNAAIDVATEAAKTLL